MGKIPKVHQNDLGGNLHGQDKIQQTTFFKKRTDYRYVLEKEMELVRTEVIPYQWRALMMR